MNRVHVTLFAILIVSNLVGAVDQRTFLGNGFWEQVWSDEFDGNSLDESKWNYETGGNGWGNNEL
jgi:hypothetical protein